MHLSNFRTVLHRMQRMMMASVITTIRGLLLAVEPLMGINEEVEW
jgi:hypothetical protein